MRTSASSLGPRAYLERQPAFQHMKRFLIHETGVHFADLLRCPLGDVKAVYADLRQLNPAVAGEDAGIMILEHVAEKWCALFSFSTCEIKRIEWAA